MTNELVWIACSDRLPPEGKKVITKIANPDRNEQVLVRKKHLWWTPDMKIYVYYSPTHWAEIV